LKEKKAHQVYSFIVAELKTAAPLGLWFYVLDNSTKLSPLWGSVICCQLVFKKYWHVLINNC
jgi:hypothetical protein